MSQKDFKNAEEAFRRQARQLGIKNPGYVVNGQKTQTLQYAHKQVVEVAKGIARELYDAMMQVNESYAVWQRLCEDIKKKDCEEEFVRLATPHLLDDARTTMAALLGQPGNDHLKEGIFDALIKDNEIRGVGGLKPVAPQLLEAYRHGR